MASISQERADKIGIIQKKLDKINNRTDVCLYTDEELEEIENLKSQMYQLMIEEENENE